MDGAIADGEGEAFPLVCTTDDDVIGNLTRSLDSYVRKGGQRRKVVLATSLKLTPPRRRNLEKRAQEKGFTLCQVCERQGIADRLYRSPRWYRELLGLAGKPSALSMVPRTRRPLLEVELVGRETDVEWLRATSGDRLLIGQPGSGKTFVVHHLVRQGWGLFLVGTEESEAAAALREQRPEVVVVDDAHRDPTQIEMLCHLRREWGQDFSIAAISWEGDRDRVAEALGTLANSQIRRLELLTRAQILEVIKQVGIAGPDDLLRELVDQAANKPGLAVTLALLCLRGDWRAVVTGQALRTTLMTAFDDLVGPKATEVLAAFGPCQGAQLRQRSRSDRRRRAPRCQDPASDPAPARRPRRLAGDLAKLHSGG